MDVSVTETQLKRIFTLAHSWEAILLLDEADVFLAKRTSDDMERNGFVSVFLRLLEYYEGILFLTTNRIEEFDPAFQSRLRLRLSYDQLNAAKRTKLWRNMLRGVEDCKDWSDEAYAKLGEEFDINGREVGNLLQTAYSLCSYKGCPLSIEVLRSIYEMSFSKVSQMGKAAFSGC
jgi:SpoVK/Ycf46/Vps4 family AAA+-type ATPase